MKNIISMALFISLFVVTSLSAEPKLLSLKPDKLFTMSYHFVLEYSDDKDLKPFIAMKGKCLSNIKIKSNFDYWIKRLKLPSTDNTIKEVVLISPNGVTVEFVAEFNSNGLRSILLSDDSLEYFMDSISSEDYFILGIVKNYAIIETIVIPLNKNGHKNFINNCY